MCISHWIRYKTKWHLQANDARAWFLQIVWSWFYFLQFTLYIDMLPADVLILITFSSFHFCISVSLSHTLAHSISLHLSSFSLPFCSYSLSFLSCVFTGRLTCFIFFPSHFSSSPFQFSSLLQRVFHYPPLAPSLSGECGGREEGSLERQRWKRKEKTNTQTNKPCSKTAFSILVVAEKPQWRQTNKAQVVMYTYSHSA